MRSLRLFVTFKSHVTFLVENHWTKHKVYIEAHSEILIILDNIPETLTIHGIWYGVHFETKSDKSMGEKTEL
jgi:hypothetical protein